MSTELSDAEKEAIRVMDLRAKMTDPTPTERFYTGAEVAELRAELERLKQAIADDAAEDTAIRRKAATVLGNWVFGDSHEVPSLTSVVERLVERAKEVK